MRLALVTCTLIASLLAARGAQAASPALLDHSWATVGGPAALPGSGWPSFGLTMRVDMTVTVPIIIVHGGDGDAGLPQIWRATPKQIVLSAGQRRQRPVN